VVGAALGWVPLGVGRLGEMVEKEMWEVVVQLPWKET
jgi:hypothetical protein